MIEKMVGRVIHMITTICRKGDIMIVVVDD